MVLTDIQYGLPTMAMVTTAFVKCPVGPLLFVDPTCLGLHPSWPSAPWGEEDDQLLYPGAAADSWTLPSTPNSRHTTRPQPLGLSVLWSYPLASSQCDQHPANELGSLRVHYVGGGQAMREMESLHYPCLSHMRASNGKTQGWHPTSSQWWPC